MGDPIKASTNNATNCNSGTTITGSERPDVPGKFDLDVTDAQALFKLNEMLVCFDAMKKLLADIANIDALTCDFTAGETISAIRAVYVQLDGLLYNADPTVDIGSRPVGISTTAGNATDTISVTSYGKLEDAALSSFNIGDEIFLGPGGTLVSTAPTTGFFVKLGEIVATNTLMVDIEEKIKL